MQQFFSIAWGGLLLATVSLMVQGNATDALLANKQGGENTRLLKKMQKRGQKAEPSKDSAPVEARLA